MATRALFAGPDNRTLREGARSRLTGELAGLVQDPNIVTVTIGEKIAGGRGTGQKAIKVFVREKGLRAASWPVPPAIGLSSGRNTLEVPTDVVELAGEPRLFGMRSGDRLRAFDGDRGTCAMTFVKNGRAYAFTNAHVVRRLQAGGVVGPVDWFDPDGNVRSDLAKPVFASELSFTMVNREDAAVLVLDDPALADPNRVRIVDVKLTDRDVIRPIAGQYWYVALGRINICEAPEPVSIVPSPVEVDGLTALYIGFHQLRLVEGVARPGISGALLCRTQGNRHIACGLIFGGVEDQFVWAYSFAPLFDRVFPALP